VGHPRPSCADTPPEGIQAILNIDPATVLVLIAGFIVAITIHEFSHAWAAWSLGDTTAQREGRLTLNPLRHLDPFGSLLLLLTIATGAPGIGWGRPVPVDPRRLRHGRTGMAVVSAAGPLSNVALALLAALAFRWLPELGVDVVPLARDFLVSLILLNVGLCVFNLLPLAPLDGFSVAVGLLPAPIAYPLARLAPYGPGILLILLFSSSLIRIDLLGLILGPPRQALMALILRAAGAG
jgi:Zn-dependent protease